jgi:hypothetical protein
MMPGSKASVVYTFKVSLKGDASTWRRIEVRSDQTLDDLHEAIFRAFDREEEHLYSFFFAPPGARGAARHRDAVEYTHRSAADACDGVGGYDAADATIASLALRRGRKFEYLFDYGDSWWHTITVEQVNGPVQPGRYPRIIETHGQSPPQYPDFDED